VSPAPTVLRRESHARSRASDGLVRDARASPLADGTLRVVARLLIIGGGRRGLGLARDVAPEGHAARIVTRSEERRPAIERGGAECWLGDPDRLATLRGALEGVTVVGWLLGSARGAPQQIQALHGPRLRSFLGQAIDSTMRGFLYEAAGSAPAATLATGERIAREECARNAIPLAVLRTAPSEKAAWREEALVAVRELLGESASH
jgi:hypothetical protein